MSQHAGIRLKKIILPTLFGVEAFCAEELQAMGFSKSAIQVEDAMVILSVEDSAKIPATVAMLNFGLRTAERVLLQVTEFVATNFDQLFAEVEKIPWHQILDQNYFIETSGYSRKSQLSSVPASQRLIKKAITKQLDKVFHYPEHRVPEDRKKGINKIQFSIVRDLVRIMLDTTGDPLHKRGYRPIVHEAPLRETLAAAILMFSFYQRNLKNGESLYDPFCGSGTFAIEAALLASGTAPGLLRHFSAEKYQFIGKPVFDRARETWKQQSLLYNKNAQIPDAIKLGGAEGIIRPGKAVRIFGTDIDANSIEVARQNAKRAGVFEWVNFEQKDIRDLSYRQIVHKTGTDRLFVVTNPPYGERLADPERAMKLEQELRRIFFPEGRLQKGIRLSVLTSHEDFEFTMGEKAAKRRKLYNGGLQCTLYHYFRIR